MNSGILCPFYGKNEDCCDIGCNYISSSDVCTIIKYCSSNFCTCGKFQELSERLPSDLSEIANNNKTGPAKNKPHLAVRNQKPIIAPFKINWSLPSLFRQVSSAPFTVKPPQAFWESPPQRVLAVAKPVQYKSSEKISTKLAPLGLLGFGLATVLLTLHNTGFFHLNTVILVLGIIYGGLAQIFTGIMAWRKNNTFEATAFTSYGLFWMTLVVSLLLPRFGICQVPSNAAMVAYLSMWAIITAVLFIGTLNMSRITRIIFGCLTILFVLLATGYATGNEIIKLMAGCAGIVTGVVAIYAGMTQVMKEMFERRVLHA